MVTIMAVDNRIILINCLKHIEMKAIELKSKLLI